MSKDSFAIMCIGKALNLSKDDGYIRSTCQNSDI